VKAELNAHDHTHDDVGGEKFAALQNRIHGMIFADQVLEEEIQPQHV
jgi:hypothetical protein